MRDSASREKVRVQRARAKERSKAVKSQRRETAGPGHWKSSRELPSFKGQGDKIP
jgi:hypothetical protein